jgi:Zn-dependent protease
MIMAKYTKTKPSPTTPGIPPKPSYTSGGAPYTPYKPAHRQRKSWKNYLLSILAIIYKAKVLLLFGSLVISMLVYGIAFGWAFGIGLVLIIAVHESGHVLANRIKGLNASWPTFIPFFGAIISLKQAPRNADDEAFIGIAGPVFGLAATLISYGLFLYTGFSVFRWLAVFGFFMHIFNLIPVVPLDGGRTVAFLGWKAWGPGLVGLAALLFINPMTASISIDPLTFIILAFIIWNFVGRVRHQPPASYNAIPRLHKAVYTILWAGLMALSIVGYFGAAAGVLLWR